MHLENMPRCPYCNRWFRTKRGLKQHITKSHTSDVMGIRILDPFTFDFPEPDFLEPRKKKRTRRRKKRSLFDLW